jgi:hypothetical protein
MSAHTFLVKGPELANAKASSQRQDATRMMEQVDGISREEGTVSR